MKEGRLERRKYVEGEADSITKLSEEQAVQFGLIFVVMFGGGGGLRGARGDGGMQIERESSLLQGRSHLHLVSDLTTRGRAGVWSSPGERGAGTSQNEFPTRRFLETWLWKEPTHAQGKAEGLLFFLF